MRELVLTPRFERAYRRLVGKTPALQLQIHPKTGAEVLLLVNIGSHEEVY